MENEWIITASSRVTMADRFDHALARLGVRRSHHRVKPGLYRLGNPTPESPVLVTANYTLSFDAVRQALAGVDAFILVLDTHGVNVWCAAGRGTFGTDEIVRQVAETNLGDVVSHRNLVVPQLGAPGVRAHEVRQRTGFRVEYGPVDAADLPRYLAERRVDPAMRTVKFGLRQRLVLVPIEAVHIFLPVLAIAAVLRLTGVIAHVYNAAVAGTLAGAVLFPLLLPWIPTRDFSTRGFVLGVAAWVPILIRELFENTGQWWPASGHLAGSLLVIAGVSAYLALNFTGATTFTSRSGVRMEIFRYVRVIAAVFVTGLALLVAAAVI